MFRLALLTTCLIACGSNGYPCEIDGKWISLDETSSLGFSANDVLGVVEGHREAVVDWEHVGGEDSIFGLEWRVAGRRARDATLTEHPPPTIGPEGGSCDDGRALIVPLEVTITAAELAANGEIEAWAYGLSPDQIALPNSCCPVRGEVSGGLREHLAVERVNMHVYGDLEAGNVQAWPTDPDSNEHYIFGAYTFTATPP